MIHVDSYYNESAAQSAGAYANSLKCPVERALNVELGKRAVQHCERMGLIQFPEKKTRQENFEKTFKLTLEDKRDAAKEASERTLNGEKIGAVCFELGFHPSTIKKWCKRFGYRVPQRNKPRKNVKPENVLEVVRLVNEEGYRMSEASAKVGHSLPSISNHLAGMGYIYDKQKVKLTKPTN